MTKYKQMPLGTKVMPGDRITISISVPQGGEIDWTPNHEDIRSIERPIPEVVLPTVPGYYEAAKFPTAYAAYRLDRSGQWFEGYATATESRMRSLMPLTRLAPEAAPAKLADRIDLYELGKKIRDAAGNSSTWKENAARIVAAIDGGGLDK